MIVVQILAEAAAQGQVGEFGRRAGDQAYLQRRIVRVTGPGPGRSTLCENAIQRQLKGRRQLVKAP